MSASTSNLIIELARLLPVLSELDDRALQDIAVRRDWRNVLGCWPSAGERAFLDAAQAVSILIERCDAETVTGFLELVDRWVARTAA